MKRIAAIILCSWSGMSVAAPLNAAQGTQSEGTIAVIPGMAVGTDGSMAASTGFASALGERGDLNLGVGASGMINGDTAWSPAISLMPRFFPTESVGFGPMIGVDGGDLSLGAVGFFVVEKGGFVLTTNIGWANSFADEETRAGEVFAFVSPEVVFNDHFTIFAEVHPVLPTAVAEEFSVEVIPGASATFGSDDQFTAALGVQIPVQQDPAVGVGATLTMNFGAGRSSSVAAADGSTPLLTVTSAH